MQLKFGHRIVKVDGAGALLFQTKIKQRGIFNTGKMKIHRNLHLFIDLTLNKIRNKLKQLNIKNNYFKRQPPRLFQQGIAF